ncbi:hypothetical protein D3C87_2049100 [compost metagenome]
MTVEWPDTKTGIFQMTRVNLWTKVLTHEVEVFINEHRLEITRRVNQPEAKQQQVYSRSEPYCLTNTVDNKR